MKKIAKQEKEPKRNHKKCIQTQRHTSSHKQESHKITKLEAVIYTQGPRIKPNTIDRKKNIFRVAMNILYY